MEIYCLSGLGVDQRAFSNVSIKGVNLINIPWITPNKNESLANYSKRLFETQNLPDNYILVGLSFGGMVAQEFAKIKKPKKLFLISTINGNHQLPPYLKLVKKLGLHKIVPGKLLKKTNFITFYFFGVNKSEHKTLLKTILNDTSSSFLKWAINAIFNWDNKQKVDAIKIHGNKDRLLPNIDSKHLIENGGHFAILTNGKQVSEIIKNSL